MQERLKIIYNINKSGYSNLANVDDAFLRYEFIEGSAKFSSDRGVINFHEDIPLFDLAVALRLISIELSSKRKDKQSLDYTESDDEVIFNKADDNIIITTTYSEETIQAKYKEFAEAVEIFYNELIRTIAIKYPESTSNKSYQNILTLTEKKS